MASILVVDDNPDVCRPLTKLLQHIGHTATYVTDGEAALQRVQATPPDLVILDVMMPGMDGMEVLRSIRAQPQNRHLRIVMFSAVADPAYRVHALSKGANDYWVKAQINFTELRTRVEQVLATEQ